MISFGMVVEDDAGTAESGLWMRSLRAEFMDNRIFNINGKSDSMLLDVLELAFRQSGHKCEGWRVTPKHGLILLWVVKDSEKEKANRFPSPMEAKDVFPTVVAWLKSGPKVELEDWDENVNHDGDNVAGWRVYCEDWGHVDNDWAAICAIKPVVLWYGK